MRFRGWVGVALVAWIGVSLSACAEGDSPPNAATMQSGAGSGQGGGGTSGEPGAGGSGGEPSGAGGAGNGGGTPTGAGGSGGAGGGGTAADHLLLSEIAVAPGPGEFVEIWNPTASPVSLDDVYLSDNATYHGLAKGAPWNPPTDNPGTDFLARFPAGLSMPPDGVLVIASSPEYESAYGACPDLVLAAASISCGGKSVPAMIVPDGGGIGDAAGSLLSNNREMVVLFSWDGDGSHGVRDLDYVTWGSEFDEATRVDKTGLEGYAPDTPIASQKPAPAPEVGKSIERCALEPGEDLAGGNGATGHDETSESLGAAFEVQSAPSPGKKNDCLSK